MKLKKMDILSSVIGFSYNMEFEKGSVFDDALDDPPIQSQ